MNNTLTVTVNTNNCPNFAGDLLKWIADQGYTIEVTLHSGAYVEGPTDRYDPAPEDEDLLNGHLVVGVSTMYGPDIAVINVP